MAEVGSNETRFPGDAINTLLTARLQMLDKSFIDWLLSRCTVPVLSSVCLSINKYDCDRITFDPACLPASQRNRDGGFLFTNVLPSYLLTSQSIRQCFVNICCLRASSRIRTGCVGCCFIAEAKWRRTKGRWGGLGGVGGKHYRQLNSVGCGMAGRQHQWASERARVVV